MKNLIAISLLGAAALSSATLFNTTVFTTSNGIGGSPDLNPTYVAAGNSYTANLTGATVLGGDALDIAWTHTFDTSVATANSAASAPYFQVTQTMSGLVRRTSGSGAANFTVSLTEAILNGNGDFNGSSNPVFNYNQNVGSQWVPFSLSATTLFSQPLTAGTSTKNDLIINSSNGVEVQINSIKQDYAPVPEPATMAVLGLGVAAMIRRRRK